jgi:hypothetical protein
MLHSSEVEDLRELLRCRGGKAERTDGTVPENLPGTFPFHSSPFGLGENNAAIRSRVDNERGTHLPAAMVEMCTYSTLSSPHLPLVEALASSSLNGDRAEHGALVTALCTAPRRDSLVCTRCAAQSPSAPVRPGEHM